MISKTRKILLFFIPVMIILSLGLAVQLVSAKTPPPASPNIIPPEINVDPLSQTVFSPNYEGVWNVYPYGTGTNLCVNACWGDTCGCAKSCGHHSGDDLQYYHYFACSGSHPYTYTQNWILSGVTGGPVSTNSTVYK